MICAGGVIRLGLTKVGWLTLVVMGRLKLTVGGGVGLDGTLTLKCIDGGVEGGLGRYVS